MSILAPARRSVKPSPRLHPSAKVTTPARPFGQGLVGPDRPALTIGVIPYDVERIAGQDGTAVVRVSSQVDPAGVYDVSRGADGLVRCDCPDYVWKREGTATMCKHGRAVVAAGLLEAPAPVANPDAPDRIPSSVSRIRVVGTDNGDGTFRRAADRWARESDGRVIGGVVADREYRVGRVAILADLPKPAPLVNNLVDTLGPIGPKPETESQARPLARPEPEPTFRGVNRIARFYPSAVDLAYESARTVGLESEAFVEPPAGYDLAERAAWYQGMASALIALDHEWTRRAEMAGF